MKTLVWWFSGTGNSWLVASALAAALPGEVELRAIEDVPKARARMGAPASLYAATGGPSDIDPEGLDIFCFPVFAFSAPSIVDRFLARLPVAIGRRAAIVVTIGGKGYEGRALVRGARRLKESGRKVVYGAALEMPEAFVQVSPATPEGEAEARTQKALEETRRIAADIAAGRESIRRSGLGGRILSWIASVGFGLLGRRLLGLTWSAGKSCNACGLCARLCPARTIRMASGRPAWSWKCEDCQRCANLCPQGAIRVSVPRLFMVLAPIFLPWGRWLGTALGLVDGGWNSALYCVGLVAVTALLALLFDLLGRLPGARDFLALSFAGGFRRRLAPGFGAFLARKR